MLRSLTGLLAARPQASGLGVACPHGSFVANATSPHRSRPPALSRAGVSAAAGTPVQSSGHVRPSQGLHLHPRRPQMLAFSYSQPASCPPWAAVRARAACLHSSSVANAARLPRLCLLCALLGSGGCPMPGFRAETGPEGIATGHRGSTQLARPKSRSLPHAAHALEVASAGHDEAAPVQNGPEPVPKSPVPALFSAGTPKFWRFRIAGRPARIRLGFWRIPARHSPGTVQTSPLHRLCPSKITSPPATPTLTRGF
jgi:hypothetical protein